MSFLAPLFLLGAAAVALPILFHLIRRTTRTQTIFSSLMFLQPSPPRVTRRSRLENIFLLLLRCLVICLLATGFARPFIQRALNVPASTGAPKRILVLVDTSASMRRGNLWEQARAKVVEVLRNASPADQVTLYTFDRQLHRQADLAAVTPGWAGTHLGNALISAAEAFEDFAGPRQIVLISDLQEGSRLDSLQGFEWPKNTEVIVMPVKGSRTTNAGLQLLTDSEDLRVRVTNAADSQRERFRLGSTEVYVPPGQSRVFPAPAVEKLVLSGDDEDFDNTVYVVPTEPSRVNVLCLGRATEKGPLYFLQRAFQPTRRQVVQLVTETTNDVSLIVVTDPVPARRQLIVEGRTALLMLSTADTLAGWLETAPPAVEEVGGGYAMLTDIDFRHPIFAPFADPRYSDFTKIHFWKHRRLQLPGARVLARFDDGDPALLEMPVGKGRLLVLTSGWHPADSQLALSSKFVPLLYSILDYSGAPAAPPSQIFVGDRPGADQPGIQPGRFAVNLDPLESKTAPLPVEELERLGVPLKTSAATPRDQRRQLLNAELENQQQLWRWLIVAALVVLIAETLMAAWLTRVPL
jgi:hypothetical protein